MESQPLHCNYNPLTDKYATPGRVCIHIPTGERCVLEEGRWKSGEVTVCFAGTERRRAVKLADLREDL